LNSVKIEKCNDEISFDNKLLSKQAIARMDFSRRRHPYIRRVGPNEWIDARTGRTILSDEVQLLSFLEIDIADLIETCSHEDEEKSNFLQISTILNNMSDWSGKTRLISDQRLIKRNYNRGRDEEYVAEVVLQLPDELKKKISSISSDYSTQADKLDSTYPSRLLKSTPKDEIDETAYKKQLKEAQSKFEKLKKYTLAELPLLEDGSFDSKYATALKIYFDDFFSKYIVFESLIVKLELFTSIVNGRLKFKQIEISREKGFVVKDQSSDGRTLPLSKLSSGEKQEILLFFDLIFNTNNDLLLLIDEPELSLHVSWQQQFLDDLLKVTKINRLQVVIATHSPQIIGSHRDIQVDLGELYNG
jgi:predicted ATP-binding protein involved in virulence